MSLRSEVIRVFNELIGNGVKITELPAGSAPTGTELIEAVQGGQSVSLTVNQVSSGGVGVTSVVAGTNVTVDNTDPQNPIVSASGGGGGGTWGSITGTLSSQTDLQAALDLKEVLFRPFHIETANYPLVLADAAGGVEMNLAGANTVTVPANATVAFPIGTLIPIVQYGAGLTSIVAAVGVTIRNSAGNLDSPAQNAPMFLRKRATNEWYLWNGTPGGGGGGSVDSVTGTTNRIAITGPSTDPVINIDSAYDTAITSAIDAKVIDSIADADTTHAPSRNAVFDALALKLNLAGGTMGGNIAMGTNKVTGLAAASGNGEAVRFEQLPAASSETVSGLIEIATQGEVTTGTDDVRAITPLKLAAATRGIQDLFFSAAGMWPRTSNGCSALTQTEIATSFVNLQVLLFDQTTQEFCQGQIILPRKYNNSTLTIIPVWTSVTPASSGTVQWGISFASYRNDDALTAAFGTPQTSDDTLLAVNDLHEGPETSAITPSGTLAGSNLLMVQISRNPASDTLNADAALIGIIIRVTTNSAIDG